MRVTPLLPASRFFQTSSVVLPTPRIRPMPVTTTLLPKLLGSFRVFADVIDCILHGTDLLRILVRNFDVESFLEGHDQLDGVERIGAQIVHERGGCRDFAFFLAQLLDHDLLHFFIYNCHVRTTSW